MSNREGAPGLGHGSSAVLTRRDLRFGRRRERLRTKAWKPSCGGGRNARPRGLQRAGRLGSGVVGIAVAECVKGSVVVVGDVNDAALAASKRNAARNDVHIDAVHSSLYDAFAPHSFDVITVHPPAVPYPDGDDWGFSTGMRVATNGGSDGSVLVLRSIAEAAPKLRPGGRLLLLLPTGPRPDCPRRARPSLPTR